MCWKIFHETCTVKKQDTTHVCTLTRMEKVVGEREMEKTNVYTHAI